MNQNNEMKHDTVGKKTRIAQSLLIRLPLETLPH